VAYTEVGLCDRVSMGARWALRVQNFQFGTQLVSMLANRVSRIGTRNAEGCSAFARSGPDLWLLTSSVVRGQAACVLQ
jgi:hypothetical protein